MTTVLNIIDKGIDYLNKHGIEDARLNMQHILAHYLECTRMDLYLRFDEPLVEAQLVPLRSALKKRAKGVPLQHILGTVFFRQHEFLTDERALIPRPETEELAEWLAKNVTLPPQAKILDVGTGSGCLGLSLAHDFPDSEVTLIDISQEALELAQGNVARLKSPISLERLRFLQSDLLAELAAEDVFHLIVANLPYIPEGEKLSREVQHDPPQALFSGKDGLDHIRRFLPQAYAHLAPEGKIALEIGIHQAEAVESLLRENNFREIQVLNDLSGIPRFPIATR